MSLEGLLEGIGGVDADEHDDEEEEHQDGTGVDDDLHHEEEWRLLTGILNGQTDHDDGQGQGRVDGLLGEDHDQGCEHHDRGQQPERPLGSRHHRDEPTQGSGEQGSSHRAAPSSLRWA